jgi:hypothetical protein
MKDGHPRTEAVAKSKRTRAVKKKVAVKRRSAPAAALADPRFRKRVVERAKVYKRKPKVDVTEVEDE